MQSDWGKTKREGVVWIVRPKQKIYGHTKKTIRKYIYTKLKLY